MTAWMTLAVYSPPKPEGYYGIDVAGPWPGTVLAVMDIVRGKNGAAFYVYRWQGGEERLIGGRSYDPAADRMRERAHMLEARLANNCGIPELLTRVRQKESKRFDPGYFFGK